MDTNGSSLGSILASTGTSLLMLWHWHSFSKMQPPAGDHVCRDGRREAEKKKECERAREGETELTQTGWSRLHVLRLGQSKLLRCSRRRRRTRVAAAQAHSREHQPRNFKAWTDCYYSINGNQKKPQMTEITTVELLGSLFGMAIKFTGSEDLTIMLIFLASSYLSTSFGGCETVLSTKGADEGQLLLPRENKADTLKKMRMRRATLQKTYTVYHWHHAD